MSVLRFEPFWAFGWAGMHAFADRGALFIVRCERDMEPRTRDHSTAWTKGHMRSDTGIDRLAGFSSATAQPLTKGRHRFVAQEASEWWCIQAEKNGAHLPVLQPVSIAPGATRALRRNSLLLIASPGLGHPVATPITVANDGRSLTNEGDQPAWVVFFSARRPGV